MIKAVRCIILPPLLKLRGDVQVCVYTVCNVYSIFYFLRSFVFSGFIFVVLGILNDALGFMYTKSYVPVAPFLFFSFFFFLKKKGGKGERDD